VQPPDVLAVGVAVVFRDMRQALPDRLRTVSQQPLGKRPCKGTASRPQGPCGATETPSMKPNHISISSVGGRLSAGFAFLLALMVALAGLAAFELTQAGRRMSQIVEVHNQRTDVARDVLESINRMAIQIRTLALLTELPAIDAEMKAFKASDEAYRATLKQLEGLLAGEPADGAERKLLAEIVAAGAKTVPEMETAARQGGDGDGVAAAMTLTLRVRDSEAAWRGKVGEFVKLQQSATGEAVAAASAGRSRSFAIGGVLLVVALGAGALVAWRLTRGVQSPIEHALQVAERIAVGDLSSDVPTGGNDELGRLLQAVASMQERLRALVGQIRETAESIQLASSEVASGNADLSQRTELAASNLQQAASSMEQLTGTVRNSADSARQANHLAAGATQVATRGGQVVARVVSTMEEINDASRKIADIIGVIDGIAFQTNILALNAAVEAARAGEQGRGFAVVASEVRSLAQRSAEAAREIKALIGGSVERVEAGTRLVGEAGSTMGDIVQSVKRVSDIIGEISHAAGEQSSGIGQVNDSVTQLDQMTQQNAALVEQSAAAAESLKVQAARLSEVVGTFRLDRAPA
jgi:methyl-accepting chemotaxis protein